MKHTEGGNYQSFGMCTPSHPEALCFSSQPRIFGAMKEGMITYLR
jgi:hypothetical protein